MSGDEITFRHMVDKREKAVDFVMSNQEREQLFDDKDISGVWSWALSDHRPLGYGMKLNDALLQVSAGFKQGAKPAMEIIMGMRHKSIRDLAKSRTEQLETILKINKLYAHDFTGRQ